MINEPTEKDLILRLKSGDIGSYELLFRRYYPTFFSFVFSMVKNRHTTEDIVQNVFMKVWLHRDTLNENLSMHNFLYVLSKREVLNHFRSKYNLVHLSDKPLETGRTVNDVEERCAVSELDAMLQRIVECMPEKRRQVFVMSRMQHLTNREIAERLNLSVRTVDHHIELALKEIRIRMYDWK